MFWFSLQNISSYKELAIRDYAMKVGIPRGYWQKAVGEVRLQFWKYLVVNNVYFPPSINRNLISNSKLFEQLLLNKNLVHIFRNGSDICSGYLENGLYRLNRCLAHCKILKSSKVAKLKNKEQRISHDK